MSAEDLLHTIGEMAHRLQEHRLLLQQNESPRSLLRGILARFGDRLLGSESSGVRKRWLTQDVTGVIE